MGKQANGTRCIFTRLLKSLVFFLMQGVSLIFSAAGAPSSSEIRALRIIPQQTTFFTAKESCYDLTIPEAAPADIQTVMPDLPAGVSFVSSRKTGVTDKNGDPATKVELWFIFDNSGLIRLPDFGIYIRGRLYKIPVDSVQVYENPQTVLPRLIIKFQAEEDSSDRKINEISINRNERPPEIMLPAGKKLHFTVYIQYAVQIVHFTWTLPKDSLFFELERYKITEGEPRGTAFNPDAVPVVRFEWQPLKPGSYIMPDIQMTASAYNGSRVDLKMPVFTVTVQQPVTQPSDENQNKETSSLFSYAFTEDNTKTAEKDKITGTVTDFKHIAELRSKERHSLPFSTCRKLRKKAEMSAGLTAGADEPSYPLLKIWLVCIIVSLVIAVLCIFLRKVFLSILFFSVTFFVTAGFVISYVRVSAHYGIFVGGSLSPIPETVATASAPMSGGNRVRIRETAGDWLYIEYNNMGGWVLQDTVLPVR